MARLLLTVVLAGCASCAAKGARVQEPGEEGLGVDTAGAKVALRSPFFTYRLDIADGLRAESWENRLTRQTLSLGRGSELDTDLDTADARIWLQSLPATVVIPAEARDKPLSLTLGGFGLYDYRHMQAFLNGQAVGVRDAPQRWREPLVIDLGPDAPARPHVRFGEPNEVRVELGERVTRSPRLEELDPNGSRGLPDPIQWPALFEKYLTVGNPWETPTWSAAPPQVARTGDTCQAVFTLAAKGVPFTATVTYQWDDIHPVLRKSVSIRNQGDTPRRLMHVRLGDYNTGVAVSDGECGFPVYCADAYFLSLAHPAGWATGQEGRVLLRQYPGRMLQPGEAFACFDAVLGVTEAGAAKQGFTAYVRQHMRRVVRGHDGPRAIFENFGSWPLEPNNFGNPRFCQNSEEDLLHSLSRVGESQKVTGRLFDACSIDFWPDHAGDYRQFEPHYFPNGFAPIKAALDALGIAPGLWVSASYGGWGLGANPALESSKMPGGAAHCLAAEGYYRVFSEGLAYQIRENGVRQIKVDSFYGACDSPDHGHLPGVYSTEAQCCAAIKTFETWDATSPEVFIMLYWGLRSPWWLLWADTLFDPGIMVEAAHPADSPTPYARDSVSVSLDQAQWYCDEVPVLGKDSLGIWLSSWWWNSSIGKERWQEGFVMDLCRGSLLAQPWSDRDWLSEPEWRQLADFIHLLRARPECFGNPRFILGNPWKKEPYGYCCSDGARAFVAINNCVWADTSAELGLGPEWGLPEGRRWDLYRWHPQPARLTGDQPDFGGRVSIALRPFEVVLLEVVPAGQPPSLGRGFESQPLPVRFAEASTPVDLVSDSAAAEGAPGRHVTGTLAATAAGGMLVLTVEMTQGGQAASFPDVGGLFTFRCRLDGADAPAQPVLGLATNPASWQAWRVPVVPGAAPRALDATVSTTLPPGIDLRCRAYFIPR